MNRAIKSFTRRQGLGWLSGVLLTAALAVVVVPAWAIFPQLSTSLTGAILNGQTPSGNAKLDQSKQPVVPGALQVQVKNVNLPDGTVLTVNIGGFSAGNGIDVGSITLFHGQGQISTKVVSQVGRNTGIGVMQGTTVILSNPAAWTP